ncbi:glutathione peroxidase GpxA [Methanobrevibacter ruminantium M1]|uniref:Glutathione peroxidase GpxA n=1 Tax=Methanobrevibacter ruminantium (strain ATCC 35063 / DSM 1093 / JCM 13430 / OCM 146 / M1) TaxID=634498 RepID=D3E061_METRM|nr:glutathione peroxidase [Methanobrevibacter ruminantium]ADC47785.1 glutathione peroxidase GpxA [Methanobrevibacter ruminantium M1]
MSIYDFEVKDINGNMVSLKEYEGQVLLIVNSATECGFTPQYNELTQIFDELNEEGFTILDFPCNQFGKQAPGTGEEIAEACRATFLVQYPIFEKIEVNGENEEPLYTYLKSEQPFVDITGEDAERLKGILESINPDYMDSNDIKWNFTKFLVDREGNVVARFEPTQSLDDVKAQIKELL